MVIWDPEERQVAQGDPNYHGGGLGGRCAKAGHMTQPAPD